MKAIILSAGVGFRISDVTKNQIPKCLLEVGGITILENCLNRLWEVGVSKVVIVVGHLADKIMDKIGYSYKSFPVEYVTVTDYMKTNNIVSFYSAKEHFNEDVILVESDVYFTYSVINKIINSKYNTTIVAQYEPGMRGTFVEGNEFVDKMILNSNGNKDLLKTVNIYYLKKEFLEKCVEPLRNLIDMGYTHLYYEQVFSNLIAAGEVFKSHVVTEWAEIDTSEDLRKAQYRFGTSETKYNVISKLYGNLWSYGVKDHCYLYNTYFPPKPLTDYLKDNFESLMKTYPSGQKEIASLLSGWLNIEPDKIIVGNGASELIRIMGKNYCVSTPSFNEYSNHIAVPLNEETWEFDKDRFLQALNSSDTEYGVIVTPNNPTSIAVSKSDINYVLNNTDKNIIIDESFGDFCNQSFTDLTSVYDNLFVLKSLSKVFGICGLRLGYLVSNNSYMHVLRNKLPIWNINGFAEAFLRQVISYKTEFRESIQRIRKERDEFYNDLKSLKGLQVWPPDGNFIFCKVLNRSGLQVTKDLLSKNIYVKNCGNKIRNGEQYLRIGCRSRPENKVLFDILSYLL
jgi:histidinol-phosphate/aromatic aminotransferase/cobyric acid decarboxylase-like protein/choline kinase